jgi:ABC-type nitrate/sulfonate/bicarbonate transport system substrate-binding protein
MGAEIAVTRGVGTIVADVRRGDGPAPAFSYTQPVLVAREETIEDRPEEAAAAVRAIVSTQRKLKQDVGRATGIGEKLFGPNEAKLIAQVVERDLPFYDPSIPESLVEGMNAFALDMGILDRPVPYERVVATRFSELWA